MPELRTLGRPLQLAASSLKKFQDLIVLVEDLLQPLDSVGVNGRADLETISLLHDCPNF